MTQKQYETKIVVDTREQNPLEFPTELEVVRLALDTGDYSAIYKGQLDKVRIERKSVPDLFSSFTRNYRNELAKIERAHAAGYKYIIAIEAPCSTIRNGCTYTRHGVVHAVKKSGLAQVRQMMTLSRKYGVEVWYCADRRDMGLMVQEYLLVTERMNERE